MSCAPSATASAFISSHSPRSRKRCAPTSNSSADGDWVATYPDPSSYIPQFFSCGGGNGNGFYCNPRLDREMQHATQLELRNPAQITRALGISRSTTHRQRRLGAHRHSATVDLTSSRLHNYEYNPVWGFLADQSWLQ